MKISTIIKKFKLEFKNVLKEIYTKNPKKETRGPKRKYTDETYINWICKVLFSGISWRGLELFLTKGDPCFNSIRTKFNEWNDIGAFKLTYITLLDKYSQKNKSNFKSLFLDSTDIVNENYFKEGVGYNGHKIANKKALKVTVIVNKDRVPVSVSTTAANNHDVTMLEETVNNSNINLESNHHNPCYLTCDKGYISNEISKNLKKKNIILNTPKRKNMKKKIQSKLKKKLLKDRFVVESFFSTFKRSYKRLNAIREKNINTLLGWMDIAFSMSIIRAV